MKLNVEMTNASLNFRFWPTFVEIYTTDKLPLKDIPFSLPFFFFFIFLFTGLLLSCFASKISKSLWEDGL